MVLTESYFEWCTTPEQYEVLDLTKATRTSRTVENHLREGFSHEIHSTLGRQPQMGTQLSDQVEDSSSVLTLRLVAYVYSVSQNKGYPLMSSITAARSNLNVFIP